MLKYGERFSRLNLFKAPWDELKVQLEAVVNWDTLKTLAKADVGKAHSHFMEKLLSVCEDSVPVKTPGKYFGKTKASKNRRRLWRRLSKLDKRIVSSKNSGSARRKTC